MNTITLIKDSLLHLLYPHICAGCGTEVLSSTSQLCIKCIQDLPVSGFEKQTNNPIEKLLTGRIKFDHATAQLYFNKHSFLQHIIHQFKYRGNKDLCYQMGLIMGNQLLESQRFNHVDVLIPLPLHERKQRKRGYNQAEILCNGIAEILKIPVDADAVQRVTSTETQTKKNRIERWQNMEGTFEVVNKAAIENKQVLLIDDVITTGATLEACAAVLSEVNGVSINIATLCYASNV